MSKLLNAIASQVHPQERSRCAVLALLSGLASVAFTIGQAGSEALFIAEVGMPALPLAMVAASLLTMLGFALYSRFLKRWSSSSYFMRLLILVGGAIAVSLPLLENRSVIYALFCLFFLGNAIVFNQYWNWASVCFDASAAKRIFPVLATSSSLGGVLGGIIGTAVNDVWGPTALVTFWSAFSLATAAVVFRYRRQVSNWGTGIAAEEDASVTSLGRTLSYIKRSPLSLWLTISAIAIVLAQFIALFLYQKTIATAFPQAQDLATFVNVYLIGSNVLEICVEGLGLPWLLMRLGISRTNLLHPCTTLASLVGLLFWPGLVSAVTARTNCEVLESGLAAPTRTLMYNALPSRLRDQVRAVLEGMLKYGGMAAAGLFLHFCQACPTRTLIFIAMGLSAIYLLANIYTHRHYLETLIDNLRAGRLSWDTLNHPLEALDADKLTEVWHSFIQGNTESIPRAALQLTATLGHLGCQDSLVRQSQHPSSKLRTYIAAALAGRTPDTLSESAHAPASKRASHSADAVSNAVENALIRLAHDPQPEVARQALLSLQALCCRRLSSPSSVSSTLSLSSAPGTPSSSSAPGTLSPSSASDTPSELSHSNGAGLAALDDLLGSPDPQIAALAAHLCAERTAGEELLTTMLASTDEEQVCAALKVTTSCQVVLVERALSSPNLAVKSCALERYLALRHTSPLGVAELVALANSNSRPAIKAALKALRVLGSTEAIQALAKALTSPKRFTRRCGKAELLHISPEALPAVRALLNSDYTFAVQSAVETLGASSWPEAIPTLYEEMESAIISLWQANLCLEALQQDQASPQSQPDPLDSAILQRLTVALQDRIRAKLMLCDWLIAATSGVSTARLLRQALRIYPSEAYGKALEIISNVGNRQAARLLVLYYEHAPLNARLAALPASVSIVPEASGRVRLPKKKEIIAWAETSTSRWLRWACALSVEKDNPMDNLLLMRQIALFQEMTLEQLEAINTLLAPAQYLAGEIIFREGDYGTKLFLLTEGSVEVIKNYDTPQATTIATLQAVSYFGEMAIIDDAPRSATIKAKENCVMQILDGENFKDLMRDMPDISMEIMRVLTARIRSLEKEKYQRR